jgi:threonine/homoserine/homoserine lactone efflux protein
MEYFLKDAMISTPSLTFLTLGAFFGLAAGISPGPLLTLVVTETLKHNKAAGIKVAIAPLITDLPIILVSYCIFSGLSHFKIVLSMISFFGGIYFGYLGYETIKIKKLNVEIRRFNPDSLKKGITANFLNPNPYIFWFTAGIPTAFKAYETGLMTVILYFVLFYLLLTGSKIAIALLTERSKTFLKTNSYKITMRILGATLFIFAALFLFDGIRILIDIKL